MSRASTNEGDCSSTRQRVWRHLHSSMGSQGATDGRISIVDPSRPRRKIQIAYINPIKSRIHKYPFESPGQKCTAFAVLNTITRSSSLPRTRRKNATFVHTVISTFETPERNKHGKNFFFIPRYERGRPLGPIATKH